jgi:hypothetical protein
MSLPVGLLQSMAFGGKVFVIGVGKAEQNVSLLETFFPVN